jgi:hypothetical protein
MWPNARLPEKEFSMKCPHCKRSISAFHAAIFGSSEPDGSRLCPCCGKAFTIEIDVLKAVPVAAASAALALLIAFRIPYIGFLLGAFVLVSSLYLTSIRLAKPASSEEEPVSQ